MPSYDDLLEEAFNQINDFERHSAGEEFQRQLCEVCLCILLMRSEAQKTVSNILFPAHVPIELFGQINIIDIYQGADLAHALPEMIIPIMLRDNEGKDLLKGNLESIKYYQQYLSEVQDVPRTCYQILTNLFGLRPGVTFDTEIQLTYVRYVDILNLNEVFPLDNNFIQPFLRLMRMFLFMRLGRYTLAKLELHRFRNYVG